MGSWDVSPALAALIVIAVLAFVLRWAFRPSRRRRARLLDAAQSSELGLLAVVVAGISRHDALQDRARLADAGIRASLSRRSDGAMDLLVFRDDAERARTLLQG
jgi:hypothetical protein